MCLYNFIFFLYNYFKFVTILFYITLIRMACALYWNYEFLCCLGCSEICGSFQEIDQKCKFSIFSLVSIFCCCQCVAYILIKNNNNNILGTGRIILKSPNRWTVHTGDGRKIDYIFFVRVLSSIPLLFVLFLFKDVPEMRKGKK